MQAGRYLGGGERFSGARTYPCAMDAAICGPHSSCFLVRIHNGIELAMLSRWL